MELSGRALYNLLRGNWLEDPLLKVMDWQIEDYRALPDKILWSRLAKLGLPLDRQSFLAYAQECDGPEELVEFLWTQEEDPQEQDQVFLLVFELWRRLLPEKQTLSILCDELDHMIQLFDRKELISDEKLEEMLDDLERILDESVDAGLRPKEALELVGQFCAHDVESFLYDYIASKMEKGQDLLASELLDGFYDYVQDTRWFDFLRARLFARADQKEAYPLVNHLLESLQEKPELDLVLEMGVYLAHEGDPHLFQKVIALAIELIQTEEDFQELLAIVADYHRCLDQEAQEQSIEDLFRRRVSRDLAAPIDHANDQDVQALRALLT